jgi:thymidylate synthase (FAD)
MKVEYDDHMGSDLSVANGARVSFGKASYWGPLGFSQDTVYSYDPEWDRNGEVDNITGKCRGAGAPLQNKDANLIGFLARGCTTGEWDALVIEGLEVGGLQQSLWDHHPELSKHGIEHRSTVERMDKLLKHVKSMASHWTPFGQVNVKLRLTCAIPIMRHVMRSTIGAVPNEVSRRYVSDTPVFEHPQLRMAAKSVKQGSSGLTLPEDHYLHGRALKVVESAIALYDDMIDEGVAPESARFYLPQGVLTETLINGTLYYWARVYNLRSDPHAQKEVRDVADEVGRICSYLFPVSWSALTNA